MCPTGSDQITGKFGLSSGSQGDFDQDLADPSGYRQNGHYDEQAREAAFATHTDHQVQRVTKVPALASTYHKRRSAIDMSAPAPKAGI
jgi:hypothetical protein